MLLPNVKQLRYAHEGPIWIFVRHNIKACHRRWKGGMPLASHTNIINGWVANWTDEGPSTHLVNSANNHREKLTIAIFPDARRSVALLPMNDFQKVVSPTDMTGKQLWALSLDHNKAVSNEKWLRKDHLFDDFFICQDRLNQIQNSQSTAFFIPLNNHCNELYAMSYKREEAAHKLMSDLYMLRRKMAILSMLKR